MIRVCRNIKQVSLVATHGIARVNVRDFLQSLQTTIRIEHKLGHRYVLPTYIWIYSPLLDFAPFNFFIFYTVNRTPWKGDQPIARILLSIFFKST
jgi:hypothetical protein